jgi:hypothetical protein
VTFSQAGAPLAVADGNGHAYVWDTASDKIVGTYAGTGCWPAWGVAFSPNGKLLAIADGNVYVRVIRQFVSQSAPTDRVGPVQLPPEGPCCRDVGPWPEPSRPGRTTTASTSACYEDHHHRTDSCGHALQGCLKRLIQSRGLSRTRKNDPNHVGI